MKKIVSMVLITLVLVIAQSTNADADGDCVRACYKEQRICFADITKDYLPCARDCGPACDTRVCGSGCRSARIECKSDCPRGRKGRSCRSDCRNDYKNCNSGCNDCLSVCLTECKDMLLAGIKECRNDARDCKQECLGGCTDGDIQPCYTGPDGTEGVGVCVAGTQTCVNGDWSACEGEILPIDELCDDSDNDCDGQVDEDLNCEPACHTCTENNPCTPENIANENFYHTHCEPTMFVQCDAFGGCFEMPCAPGTVWDQDAYTCVH